MILPKGYGYESKGQDRWAMTWMMMNHRRVSDSAYIEYKVQYDTAPQKPVTPYWLDVKNCLFDPIYDVPGGGKKGSTHRKSFNWTAPESGRIVAGGGHVHGGAKDLSLNRRRCELYASKPTWGSARHPFYNVRPVLHEPGPIHMSEFTSARGFGVRRGETLRLDADYDGQLLHTRVMGIFILYMAEGDPGAGARGCAKPRDLRNWGPPIRGRKKAPRFKVPIIGIKNGKAREIAAPRGARKRLPSGARINVGDQFFSQPNVSIRSGGRLQLGLQQPRAAQHHRGERAAGLLVHPPRPGAAVLEAVEEAGHVQAVLRPAPGHDDPDDQGHQAVAGPAVEKKRDANRRLRSAPTSNRSPRGCAAGPTPRGLALCAWVRVSAFIRPPGAVRVNPQPAQIPLFRPIRASAAVSLPGTPGTTTAPHRVRGRGARGARRRRRSRRPEGR